MSVVRCAHGPSKALGGAVVTGAGRGLGKEIARLLVERGHLVLVTYIDEASARATAAELGERAVARAPYVRDHPAVVSACDDIVARAGRLAVWVNNAGVLRTGPAREQDDATRRLMIEVNAQARAAPTARPAVATSLTSSRWPG